MTALLFHRKETYGDYLAEYIGHVKEGELAFVPWVYCALAQGTDKQKESAACTLAEVLAGLSLDGLVRMDLRMRETTSMEWSIHWRTLRLEDLFAKNQSLEACRAVLVFSTFHPDGYIREQAVAALGTHPQALPAVLLRCNDWVAQVRRAALESLKQLLDTADGGEIAAALPILEKLRRSGRCRMDDILPLFFRAFRKDSNLLRLGLASGDVRARRLCISLLPALGEPDTAYLLERVKREPDPFLRKLLYQTLLGLGVEGMALSRRFLGDKYPPNRVLALEYLAEHGVEDLFEQAVTLLMDKSGRVREAAREVVVQADKEFDLRQFYRERLSVRPAVAILGLGETGNREDCPVIGNFLSHPQPAVARAAMTALMGLDPESYAGAVTEKLAADQPGVVKTAALLLAKYRSFDPDRVFAILQASPAENTRLKCAALLFCAGKWDRLTYALTLLGSGYEKLDQACRRQLEDWSHTYNRSYAVLGEEQRRRILALLEEKGAYLRPAMVKQLRFLSK